MSPIAASAGDGGLWGFAKGASAGGGGEAAIWAMEVAQAGRYSNHLDKVERYRTMTSETRQYRVTRARQISSMTLGATSSAIPA